MTAAVAFEQTRRTYRVRPPVVSGDSVDLGSVPVEVSGETFRLEQDNGCFYLTHRNWSLLGMGATPALALHQLIEEAREIRDELEGEDEGLLSSEARRLREFVIRLS